MGTNSFSYFWNISMTIASDEENFPILVLITDEIWETKLDIYANKPQTFVFKNIETSNYRVRVIIDANQNGQWDTGSYLKRIQPERVIYYPDVIEMRANWEKNETFIISN